MDWGFALKMGAFVLGMRLGWWAMDRWLTSRRARRVMRNITPLLLAGLLVACGTPSGQGRAATPYGTQWTDAADMGGGRWLITCTNEVSACTWRAAQVCPGGYVAGDVTQTASVAGAMGPAGGGFGTTRHYQMSVTCRT